MTQYTCPNCKKMTSKPEGPRCTDCGRRWVVKQIETRPIEALYKHAVTR